MRFSKQNHTQKTVFWQLDNFEQKIDTLQRNWKIYIFISFLGNIQASKKWRYIVWRWFYRRERKWRYTWHVYVLGDKQDVACCKNCCISFFMFIFVISEVQHLIKATVALYGAEFCIESKMMRRKWNVRMILSIVGSIVLFEYTYIIIRL